MTTSNVDIQDTYYEFIRVDSELQQIHRSKTTSPRTLAHKKELEKKYDELVEKLRKNNIYVGGQKQWE